MKLKHPTIPGAFKNVPDEVAERWLSNGWTRVAVPAKKTASKSSPKK